MKETPRLTRGPHDHWKSLIKGLEKTKKIKEVELILIRPIRPPKPVPGDPRNFYDKRAYVYGKGSDFYGTFKHLTNCVWEPEPEF